MQKRAKNEGFGHFLEFRAFDSCICAKVPNQFLEIFFRTPHDLFLNFDVESSRFTTLQFSTAVEVRVGIVS